jgi:hypothetical protein
MSLSKMFLDHRGTRLVVQAPLVVEKRHHTIISGTGRSGTTFLVKLLTNLGLDTGYHPDSVPEFANCNAGLEKDLRDENAPYIVKNPWICDYIEEIVANPAIAIDYAIIPMRTLEAAAESRRHVDRTSDRGQFAEFENVPGGLWHTDDPSQQEAALARQLHKLLVGLAKSDSHVILLHYPRLTQDPDYLFDKLRPLVGDRPFLDVFRKTVDRSLVHQYTENDRA